MTAVSETQVQIRISKAFKEESSVLFESMGMSLSEAVSTFSRKRLQNRECLSGRTFRIKTLGAMRETEEGLVLRRLKNYSKMQASRP